MQQEPAHEVTRLLDDLRQGDASAADRLIPLLYAELRDLARGFMHDERPDHTLQPTALVHEAYLRLIGQRTRWRNRAHFLAIAAKAMRRVLLDHARRQRAEKRGGGRKVTLDEGLAGTESRPLDVIALDAALERLADLDERQARVVELRFFGGLSVEEVEEVLGISAATVKRDWRHARAWLARELRSGGSTP